MLFTITQATESVAAHDENYKLAKYSLRLTDSIVSDLKNYIFELACNHSKPEVVSMFHNTEAFEKLKAHVFNAVQTLFSYEQIKQMAHAEDYLLDLYHTYKVISSYFATSNSVYSELFSDIAENELPDDEDLYQDKF